MGREQGEHEQQRGMSRERPSAASSSARHRLTCAEIECTGSGAMPEHGDHDVGETSDCHRRDACRGRWTVRQVGLTNYRHRRDVCRGGSNITTTPEGRYAHARPQPPDPDVTGPNEAENEPSRPVRGGSESTLGRRLEEHIVHTCRCGAESTDMVGAEPVCDPCGGRLRAVSSRLADARIPVLTTAGDVVCRACSASPRLCMCARISIELVGAHRAVLRRPGELRLTAARFKAALELGVADRSEAVSWARAHLSGPSSSPTLTSPTKAPVDPQTGRAALGSRARPTTGSEYRRVRTPHGSLVHLVDRRGVGLCAWARRASVVPATGAGPRCARCEAAASVRVA